MCHVPARLLILLVGGLLLLWCLHSGPAGARPAPAHAAGSLDSTATASPATVRTALRAHRHARAAYAEWQRARACLALGHGRLRVDPRPHRGADEAVWRDVQLRWRLQRRDFDDRVERLVQRMRRPGGTSCGSRWAPLARWVGWPRACIPTLIAIVDRESSGRARAYNPVISCTGLTQIWPGNVAYTRLSWAGRIAWLMDPENNLRAALRLYRQAGWAPWSL